MDLFRVSLMVASALPLGLFIFYYTTESVPGRKLRRFSRTWLSTPFGPVWLSQKIALLSIILSILFYFLFGDYALRRPLTDLLYTILIGMFWAHFILLRKVQKGNGPARDHHPEGPADPTDHDNDDNDNDKKEQS